MKLSNIIKLGRFKNKETGQEYNVKKGRNLQRSTDHYFYTYSGGRIFITDADFHHKHEKIT
jgi:hypothetical protein